jgi:protein-L-isoaspartate(D-aspartate) O-methyltransferase
MVLFFLFTCFSCSRRVSTDNNNDDAFETVKAQESKGEDTEKGNIPGEPAFNLYERGDTVPLNNKEAFIQWGLNSTEEEFFIAWRWDRAAEAIKRKHITQQRVLEAFLRTPRELFARKHNRKRAYEDAALWIGYGQTISGPHMVSKMADELNPMPEHRVLEIGTGSGYQSAVFSNLCHHVFTIEIVEALALETAELQESILDRYPEYKNIRRKIGDGYYGWPEYAPFHRIAVTCGIDHIPPPLLEQLADDGIMLIPVGPPSGQTMLKVIKSRGSDGKVVFSREDVYKGKYYPIFVPFTAKDGKRHSIKRDM